MIIVDCELADIAADRFTAVELILRTVTGTVVSRHALPSSATSTNRNLRFPLTGLTTGGDFQFALGATVRGRAQEVIVTLSNLRYQRDGAAPVEPIIRDWAKQEVAKEASVHEARDARIEQELLAGDQTLPAPTGVGARRSPTWAAATSTHQDQTDADAFTIPANGYAQFHATGEAAWASPILHVNEWRVPQTFIVYTDATGSILLISDGTRVRLRNRNAAGTGAYPNRSLLLLGRGFQWFTWPEAAPTTGVVTVLTEQQVRDLIPTRFERAPSASPATLPVGSYEISVKMSQGANRVQKRLLLSQISASTERYRLRIGNANVDFSVSYTPGTRTLTYSGASAGDIMVIGEA